MCDNWLRARIRLMRNGKYEADSVEGGLIYALIADLSELETLECGVRYFVVGGDRKEIYFIRHDNTRSKSF